jgi:hypothetical protein
MEREASHLMDVERPYYIVREREAYVFTRASRLSCTALTALLSEELPFLTREDSSEVVTTHHIRRNQIISFWDGIQWHTPSFFTLGAKRQFHLSAGLVLVGRPLSTAEGCAQLLAFDAEESGRDLWSKVFIDRYEDHNKSQCILLVATRDITPGERICFHYEVSSPEDEERPTEEEHLSEPVIFDPLYLTMAPPCSNTAYGGPTDLYLFSPEEGDTLILSQGLLVESMPEFRRRLPVLGQGITYKRSGLLKEAREWGLFTDVDRHPGEIVTFYEGYLIRGNVDPRTGLEHTSEYGVSLSADQTLLGDRDPVTGEDITLDSTVEQRGRVGHGGAAYANDIINLEKLRSRARKNRLTQRDLESVVPREVAYNVEFFHLDSLKNLDLIRQYGHFASEERVVMLRALRPIAAGNELFVSYGLDYWKAVIKKERKG